LYGYNFINVLFAELPALFFYSIISLLGFSWAEISHSKIRDQQKVAKSGTGIVQLRPYLIAVNIFMYVMLFAFAVVYFSFEEDKIIVNCATPLKELERTTDQEYVAIIYVIIYAVLSLAMLSLIEFYGAKIIHKLSTLPDSTFKKAHYQTTAMVMIFCGVFLILQLIYLITRAVKEIQWSPTATMIFLYCADLPSTLFFLFSFRKPYIGKKVNTKSQSMATKGGTTLHMNSKVEKVTETKEESIEEDNPEFGGDKPIPRNKKVQVSSHRLQKYTDKQT